MVLDAEGLLITVRNLIHVGIYNLEKKKNLYHGNLDHSSGV